MLVTMVRSISDEVLSYERHPGVGGTITSSSILPVFWVGPSRFPINNAYDVVSHGQYVSAVQISMYEASVISRYFMPVD